MTKKKQICYSSLPVTDPTRAMINHWKKALEEQYKRRVTYDEVLQYLLDMAGPPESHEKLPPGELDPRD